MKSSLKVHLNHPLRQSSSTLDGAPNLQGRILLHPPSRWSNSFSKPTEQNSPSSSMQMELQIIRAKFSSILHADGAPNRQSRVLLHPPNTWSYSSSKSSEQTEFSILQTHGATHPPNRQSRQNSPPSSKHMELLILQIVRAESSSILQVDGATHSPNQQSKILLHPLCRWSSKSSEQNPPPSSK